MARIAGVNLPNKPIDIALTYIYGIGRSNAVEICKKAGLKDRRRVNELTEDELIHVREVIDREHKVEGDLRREVAMNIKRLMDLGSSRRPDRETASRVPRLGRG